jgi:hypothetical protein
MKSFLHLFWWEVLRLRVRLIWLTSLLLIALGLPAWITLGPSNSSWESLVGLVPLTSGLLTLTLLFFSYDLILPHTATGTRQPLLTQPIPRLPLVAAKLTLLALALGLYWAQHAAMALGIVGSSPGLFWATTVAWVLPIACLCLTVSWLAAQSETPAGIAKYVAAWSIIGIAVGSVGAWTSEAWHWTLPSTPSPTGDFRFALLVLAPTVIAIQFLPLRHALKLAASAIGLLLLASSPYYSPPQPSLEDSPQFPQVPVEVHGQATVLKGDVLLEFRIRLEPGLLASDEYALLANVSLVQNDGARISPTAVRWTQPQLVASRRSSTEGGGNLAIAASFPFLVQSPLGLRDQVLGGEAILRVFRLEKLPVTLAPGETELTFRHHGRNHRLLAIRAKAGLTGTLWRPGFAEPPGQDPAAWSMERKLGSPAAIRATIPGQAPRWLFPELTEPDPGFAAIMVPYQFAANLPAPASEVDQLALEFATLEFFEDQPVRILRVRLVPEE